MKNLIILGYGVLSNIGIEILERITVTDTENIVGIIAQVLIIILTIVKLKKEGGLSELSERKKEKLKAYVLNIVDYIVKLFKKQKKDDTILKGK